MWIAGRDGMIGEWSQAGNMCSVGSGDLWVGMIPRRLLPPPGSPAFQATQKDMMVRKILVEIPSVT
jgi:hypothetical protein